LDWYHPLILTNVSRYVEEILFPQWTDLIQNYQPEVLWCDGDWVTDSATWGSERFLAWVFNDSPVKDTIVVDDRFGTDCSRKHGSFFTPEYDASVYLDHKWEANMGIDIHSYGINRLTPADKYYTAEYLINILVRSVANGGNLLLDIGPRSDGTIPTIMQERLLQIGDWLSVNGEAIYSTRKWRLQQNSGIDNSTMRYTASKDQNTIYVHILTWPGDNTLVLADPKPGSNPVVTMLGVNGNLPLKSGPGGLQVTLPTFNPGNPPPSDYIWVLKLTGFS